MAKIESTHPDGEVTKECTKCGITKDATKFTKDKSHKTGLHSWCKECHARQIQAYRVKLKDTKLCSLCGKKDAIEGKTRCSSCSKKHNASTRERIKKYVVERRCTKCGSPAEENYKMCNFCRLKHNQRLKEIHQKFSIKVGDYYNNRCYICRLESTDCEVYECHHIDPSSKESQISLLSSKDWETVVIPELQKCCYLCKICHARLHAGRFDEDITSGELILIPGKVKTKPMLKVVGE